MGEVRWGYAAIEKRGEIDGPRESNKSGSDHTTRPQTEHEECQAGMECRCSNTGPKTSAATIALRVETSSSDPKKRADVDRKTGTRA